MKESKVAIQVRLAVQSVGTILFRNTVGRFQLLDQYGLPRWIQVGLCVGSSDYIGFTEYTIKPDDVGRKIAVITAVETKRSNGGKKAHEQHDFINRIRRGGGIAFFASNPDDAKQEILKWQPNKNQS